MCVCVCVCARRVQEIHMYIECYVSARISSVRCVRPIFLLKVSKILCAERSFRSIRCRKFAFIRYVIPFFIYSNYIDRDTHTHSPDSYLFRFPCSFRESHFIILIAYFYFVLDARSIIFIAAANLVVLPASSVLTLGLDSTRPNSIRYWFFRDRATTIVRKLLMFYENFICFEQKLATFRYRS